MSDRVYVTAIFRIKEGFVDQAIAVFNELAVSTRAEPGCVEYGFYQDHDDARLILAIETWRDADAIAAHLASAHLKSALGSVTDLLDAAPMIHQCEKII